LTLTRENKIALGHGVFGDVRFWAAGGFDVENWETLRLLGFWRWAGLWLSQK